jgi:hypothetical protein
LDNDQLICTNPQKMPRPALDGGSRGFFYEDHHPKKCVGYMVRIADIHQQAI